MTMSLQEALIAALEPIFPKEVSVAALPLEGPFPLGFTEEEVCIEGSNALRKQEFRAGRACAREAMKKLGCPPSPIPAGAQRGPCWPSGVVGSISHTRECCVAAVAFMDDFKSLGLDMEQYARLKPELWRLVLTRDEAVWVEGFSESERVCHAALIFSAKEAFYKYQFPLTQTWLGFQDVEVDVSLEEKAFVVSVLKIVPGFADEVTSFSGRFSFCEDYVLTSVY